MTCGHLKIPTPLTSKTKPVQRKQPNWLKDLRTELFRRMYDEPIHPANLRLESDPVLHADADEIYRATSPDCSPAGRTRNLHTISAAPNTGHFDLRFRGAC